MTISLAQFRVKFPEFVNVEDSQIEPHIASANLMIADDVWQELAEEGQYYQAATLLVTSPTGHRARLSDPGRDSSYEKHLKYLRKAVPIRMVVTGGT